MKKQVINLDALQQPDTPEEATLPDWQAAMADSASAMADLHRFTDVLARRVGQDANNLIEALIQSIDASLRQLFAPRTLYGDAFLVYSKHDKEALDRLASSKYFLRGKLFVPKRWQRLETAFRERQGHQRSAKTAWPEVVAPALFIALSQPRFACLALHEIYPFLRSETRMEIEKDLLAGSTTDRLETKAPPTPLPDEDTPEALALDAELASQYPDQGQIRVETLLLLQQLPPQEAQAIYLYEQGFADDEVAQHLGVQEPALRQLRSRGMKQLRKLNAAFE